MPRYAIYYMPKPDSHFWRLGSSCLGYDASDGCEMISPGHKIFSNQNEALHITEAPRKYGFHATLKAPFALKAGHRESEFIAAARAFADEQAAFDLPQLAVQAIGDFIALVPQSRQAQLHVLADACVREFETFRAPLTQADLQRRLAGNLTPQQKAALESYGYPYVFEDFRFHMTLTGKLDAKIREIWLAGMTDIFSTFEQPLHCQSIAIFKQEKPDGRFRVLTRLPFGAAAAA